MVIDKDGLHSIVDTAPDVPNKDLELCLGKVKSLSFTSRTEPNG